MTDLTTQDPAIDGGEAGEKTKPWYRSVPKAVTAAGLVLVLPVAGVAVYAATINHSVETNLVQAEQMPPEVPLEAGGKIRPAESPSGAGAGAVNYVIVGLDKKSPGKARSDALMVLHLDADRKGAALISFPRNVKVQIPGHGKSKIDSAYAMGGSELAVTSLEDLLDVRMDHVAAIDFDGLVKITEQVGGVTVNNPHASQARGFDFPAGPVKLQGEEALAYVSQVDNLPGGDASRAERQRLVMQAIFAKITSKDMLLNPMKFNRFMGSAVKQVSVDRDLSVKQLRDTAMSVRFGPNDLLSVQAPGTSGGAAQLKELKTALKNDTLADYAKQYPNG